jgi:hypothetical protein
MTRYAIASLRDDLGDLAQWSYRDTAAPYLAERPKDIPSLS